MPLRPDFQFSQTNLQDYLDCPRRFELRYVLGVQWPAVISEPVLETEKRIELGHRFHLLIHQHILGIPAGQLQDQIEDSGLLRWWQNYQNTRLLAGLPVHRYPEIGLSTWLDGSRLMAQYDLLAVEAGQRAVIVDWKTSHRRPLEASLRQRIQTRLYPFLLAEAGRSFNNGQPLHPNQIEMIYWFANFPDQPFRLAYSQEQYQADQAYLSSLTSEIRTRKEGTYWLTSDEKYCALCQYRSLCNRGQRAGDWEDLEDESIPENGDRIQIDFDQIAEIEF